MRYTQISARNLKGRTFEYNLSPITVVTATGESRKRHMAGKSSVTDALRLAGLGYDPRLGKRPMDTFRLATGETMSVAVKVDGKPMGNQTWKTGRAGAISKEGEPAIVLPSMLFDLSEFLGMTGPDRSKYVFKLADPEKLGMNLEALVGALRGVPVNQDEAPKLEDLIGELTSHAQNSEEAGKNVQQWVEEFVTKLEGELKTASDTVKRFEAAGQVTVGATEEKEIPADIDEQLKKRREELQSLNSRIDVLNQKQAGLSVSIQAIGQAATDLRMEDQSAAISTMNAEREKLEIEMGTIEVVSGHQLQTAERARDKAIANQATAKAQFESEVESHAEIDKGLEDVKSEAACHCCGQKLPKKLALKLISEKEEAWAKSAERVAKAKTALKEAGEASKKADAKYSELDGNANKRAAIQYKISAAQSKLAELNLLQTKRDTAKAKIEGMGNADDMRHAFQAGEQEMVSLLEKRDAAKAALDLLEPQSREMVARRERERLKQQNVIDRDAARISTRVLKAAKQAISDERDKFNGKVWDTLLETARKFTDGLMEGELKFHEGELGYFAGQQWVSYKTLSGAEQVLAFLGVSVALCQASPIKLVIIDEIARVYEIRMEVLERLLTLIKEGVIDQAIVVDTRGEDYIEPFSGWMEFSIITVPEKEAK